MLVDGQARQTSPRHDQPSPSRPTIPHSYSAARQICSIKQSHSGRLEEYSSPTAVYVPGRGVWQVDAPIDIAFPCATQASTVVVYRTLGKPC